MVTYSVHDIFHQLSVPDKGSAGPKEYFDEWPEIADISGSKKKKVGPDKRNAVSQYFRTANIFNSDFARLQLCALLKQQIHQLFFKSIFEPNYFQYAKVPVYQDVVEPLLIV